MTAPEPIHPAHPIRPAGRRCHDFPWLPWEDDCLDCPAPERTVAR